MMKQCMRGFIVAFSMYSKIPMPRCEWDEESMSYALCFWPLVGAVIGGLVYGWGVLASKIAMNSMLFAAGALLISLLITGGIHLDGLLDTSDALSSWQTRQRRLEILKDPHTGAFAIITCVFYAIMLFAIYTQVNLKGLLVICLGFILSRALSAFAIVSLPKANKDGTVAAFSNNAKRQQVKMTMTAYVLVIVVAAMLISPLLGGIMIVVAMATYGYYLYVAMKYFDGTTGDVAGWFLSICEVTIPLAIVITQLIAGSVK